MIFKDPFQFQTIMILIVTEQYTSYQTCILLFFVGLEENDAICQFVQVLLILDLSLARIMFAIASLKNVMNMKVLLNILVLLNYHFYGFLV